MSATATPTTMAFSLVQNFWQKGLQRSSSGSGAQEAENDELQG